MPAPASPPAPLQLRGEGSAHGDEPPGDRTLAAASDILVDGTQDPTRECDGISLGLGFTTRASSEGEAVAGPPEAAPCPPDE